MINFDLRLIGTLVKLHGFKGRFLLISEVEINEEIENWESVFILTDGLPIPFFIDFIDIQSETSAIIGFEDVTSTEKAKEFLNCKVYQEAALAGEESFKPSELKGYRVYDKKHGFIGEIDQILEIKQNLLLRILLGDKEILIPVNNEIISKVNHKKKEVSISSPEGLLELYL